MEEKKRRIEELVRILNEASDAYYNGPKEIMSNYEWDALFDELTELEDKTGYILDNSPTQNVGEDDSLVEGEKEEHEYPALSLKKSKSPSDLQKWAGTRAIWLSWKLDGLTLVATYDNGHLTKLMTRGNGTVGTNITYLAPYITGILMKIEYKGHLVVRGETVISYADFETVNATADDEEAYANPRNLVSGTLSLDKTRANEVKERGTQFIAFTLVHLDEEMTSWGDRMNFLEKLGFNVVERELTNADTLVETIDKWTEKVNSFGIPVDGLVITYDDTVYASQGTVTNHHANNAGMAFKWQDTSAETILDHIEWSCAANNITPVAVFDAVQLEGTTVERASLCNISEMKRLGIGANRKTHLEVIKANMIIPKCIAANANGTSFEIPSVCPVCGAPTEIHISNNKLKTETLHCSNPKCSAKHIKKYARFVSKTGLDIDGLSLKTVSKFINEKFITDFADIFDIAAHKDKIVCMEGFGSKSYDNLINSLEKARQNVNPISLLHALCIPMIGIDAAKKIINSIGSEEFERRVNEGVSFEDIDGIGPERSNNILSWFADEDNKEVYQKLKDRLNVATVVPTVADGKCKGMIFVITGDVHTYKNRDEFKSYVEAQGGKVTGSVSKNTNYLVNNDATSMSSKNKKAKELNVPIITEDEFISIFG